jgi:transposase
MGTGTQTATGVATREPRRQHARALKTQVLAACAEPGASVAAVAQAHGLNANLVHKWRRGIGVSTLMLTQPVRRAAATNAAFIPLTFPSNALAAANVSAQGQTPHSQAPADQSADIRIEWRRGGTAICVSWPVTAAPQCASWLLQCLVAK